MLPTNRRESEATQEASDSFILTNISRTPCVLYGYPRVTLYDDGRLLPFTDQDGHGGYLVTRTPRRLLLDPGVQVYFKVAKQGCETGIASTQIRVWLPGEGTIASTLTHSGLGYCRKPLAGRHRLDLSAIVAAPSELG